MQPVTQLANWGIFFCMYKHNTNGHQRPLFSTMFPLFLYSVPWRCANLHCVMTNCSGPSVSQHIENSKILCRKIFQRFGFLGFKHILILCIVKITADTQAQCWITVFWNGCFYRQLLGQHYGFSLLQSSGTLADNIFKTAYSAAFSRGGKQRFIWHAICLYG